MRTTQIATLAVAAMAASTLALAGPASAGQPAPAAVTRYAGTAGWAAAVRPAVHASTATPSLRPRGTRRTGFGPATRTAAGAPVSASAEVRARAGNALHNFNGVSSLDSEKTNFNAEFQPPDQGLCAGNGFVLEAVNSAYRIFRPNGTRVRGPFNVNDLFDEGAAEFTSDPRCWYDPPTHTWFAVILFLNASFTASRIDIAVNTSGDPTTLWHQFRINTTNLGGRGCPCFGDQPTLGIDGHNLYVSANDFSINGPQFDGAHVYAISKADLIAGRKAHFAEFPHLRIAGQQAASVQPAATTGPAGAEFFLSSLDPNGTGTHRQVGVWALTHREAVGRGGMPTLTSTVITSEPYRQPPPAEQAGTTGKIDSGDDRMQQTAFVGGTLWGELTTGVDVTGASQTRAGAAWFAVRPSLHGDRISGAVMRRQGYVAPRGSDVIYPALQPDAAGRAAMVFTLTGAQRFPSAAYATLRAGAAAFGPITIAAAGAGPYLPRKGVTRWGDYSYAVPAPGRDAAWLATEYVPPPGSQTTDGRANWGTRVLEVALR